MAGSLLTGQSLPRMLRQTSLRNTKQRWSPSRQRSAASLLVQRTKSASSLLGNDLSYQIQDPFQPDTHISVLRRTSSFGGGPLIAIAKQHASRENLHLRWIVLALACSLLFGNYYAYDNPAALNISLQQFLGHSYDDWQYELNLLYAVYSFPNMFLPLLGGQLIDRYPPHRILIIFSLIITVGQTIFSIGVTFKSFPTMIIGRILFGIGSESVSVIQSSITTMFFKDKELAFALGMNIAIARLGSVTNSILTPLIVANFGVPAAVWCGTMSCYISTLAVLVLTFILRANHQRMNQNGQDDELEPLINQTVLGSAEKSSFTSPIMSISKLPYSFWLLCAICISLYGTVVPFNTIASDFLMSKWYPGDTEMAGFVMRYLNCII